MKHIGMATLGRDAEMRRTPQGDSVVTLSLAVNFYDKSAENNRGTQWIRATLWGERGEKLVEYLTKGSRHCFTLSDLHMHKYTDKDGYDAYSLEARVDDVELGPKREGGGDAGGGSSGTSTGQRRPASGGSTSAPSGSGGGASKQTGFDDDDSDIPF
jgi:single-strand DNA-binding protein